MESQNGTLNVGQINALSTVYLVSLSISLIGSFSVLVVSIARWRHLQEQVMPLVQLALADLLAALILMFTSGMNLYQSMTHNLTNSVIICEHALPLSLTFYCVSFLLVVVYAWESKSYAVQGWREGPREGEESHCRKRMGTVPVYGFVWFMPTVFYLVFTPHLTGAKLFPAVQVPSNIINDDASTYCTSCILFLHIWRDYCSDDERTHDLFTRCFLFIAVILVLVSCTVLYYKVGSWYRRYEEEGLFAVERDGLSRRRLKGMFSTAQYMMVVIIVCWAPALLLLVLSVTNIPRKDLFPLYVIQALTVSLQGYLNSIVYAWRRPNFREAALGERMPLLQNHAPLAYFDESLRETLH